MPRGCGAYALAGGTVLLAQQPAAEAPAPDRRILTRPAVVGMHGVVAAGHPLAASAGLQMLLKGGNAFDAAVAVGAMAALVEPEMNGSGGNGFATLFDRKSGKVHSLAMAGRGATSAPALRDDAGDAQLRDEGRRRARQPRRLPLATGAPRDAEPRRGVRARDRVRAARGDPRRNGYAMGY